MSRRSVHRFVSAALLAMMAVGCARAASGAPQATAATHAAGPEAELAALKARVAALQALAAPPELGEQMLQLQIRHDRLWWAGRAGNWTLAYFMVGELGEALHGIEQTQGDAAQLQPQKLSEVMPSIMDPAIRNLQRALEAQDVVAFERAYDRLSAACNACHQVAGNGFLHIQRPQTRLLDNLRYEPAGP